MGKAKNDRDKATRNLSYFKIIEAPLPVGYIGHVVIEADNDRWTMLISDHNHVVSFHNWIQAPLGTIGDNHKQAGLDFVNNMINGLQQLKAFIEV